MIDRHLGNFMSNKADEADINVLNMLNAKYIVLGDDEVVENPGALGNAWFVDSLIYVKNADSEMAALDYINPAVTAVSDEKFREVLGDAVPVKMPGDTIYETGYSPDRLTYRARSANGGLAVFSEVYFPWGWKAYVGDTEVPVGRVDYLLRAVRIPSGDHKVTLVFDPQSVKTTTVLSFIGIILIYLGVVAAVVLTFIRCRRGKGEVNS